MTEEKKEPQQLVVSEDAQLFSNAFLEAKNQQLAGAMQRVAEVTAENVVLNKHLKEKSDEIAKLQKRITVLLEDLRVKGDKNATIEGRRALAGVDGNSASGSGEARGSEARRTSASREDKPT